MFPQANATFRALVGTANCGTRAVAIASNESFGGWTKTFTNPRLCAAIVDRLAFGGNIIETGTDSYRLAVTRARAEAAAAVTS
ncbi:ATP-binding protein [Streptomyces polyrhachis]|uniref:ATP-binding protein n=1 Tax=Streptomyces polyrhachis TaxID=1282885 RepID=A0ABW2GMF4_9ACTN